MPTSRTKKPEYRDLTYNQLQQLTIPEAQKMASNTKKKKLSSIKQIFDIAIDPRYGYLDENLAEPFLLKEPKKRGKAKAKIERKPLSEENINRLFHTEIFRQKVKTSQKTAHKYWIPLIAIYSGMRQNEICQLHIEDIKNTTVNNETIYYFDINDREKKHLKNDNAQRSVPIHPQLIKLGLMEYIQTTAKQHNRVFPQLRFHPIEERYNTDYNKTFMNFFRKNVTRDPSQVFHSLRHNVGDQLLKNAVKHRLPKDLMNQIMGHQPDRDETSQTYSQGYGIAELFEGIKTIQYETYI